MLLKQSSGNKAINELKKNADTLFKMKLFANNCHMRVIDFHERNP